MGPQQPKRRHKSRKLQAKVNYRPFLFFLIRKKSLVECCSNDLTPFWFWSVLVFIKLGLKYSSPIPGLILGLICRAGSCLHGYLHIKPWIGCTIPYVTLRTTGSSAGATRVAKNTTFFLMQVMASSRSIINNLI